MTQECSSQHCCVRLLKNRDLAARSARDHLGLCIQQGGRVESQGALFIGHSSATLATRHGLRKAAASAGNAHARRRLAPDLCGSRLTTAGGVSSSLACSRISTSGPSTHRRCASSASAFMRARVFDGIADLIHWIG
jgi:hypothetical protein